MDQLYGIVSVTNGEGKNLFDLTVKLVTFDFHSADFGLVVLVGLDGWSHFVSVANAYTRSNMRIILYCVLKI